MNVWDEPLRLATSYAMIAGPVLIGLFILRREPTVRWIAPWHNHWTGFDVTLLFLLGTLTTSIIATMLMASPLKPTSGVAADALGAVMGGFSSSKYGPQQANAEIRIFALANILAAPLILFGYQTWKRVHQLEPMPQKSSIKAVVRSGFIGWLLGAPLVFVIYLVSNAIAIGFGLAPTPHPLSRADFAHDPNLIVLFIASTCLFTPIIEELIFRRALLPWAIRMKHRADILILIGVAATIIRGDLRLGPVLFAVCLGVFYLFLRNKRMRKGRTIRAIHTTAVLFAGMHAAVWPSPIPLYFLGLILGMVVLRHRSVLPAIILHGLFNLISTIYLLRNTA
ncbi:MAG: lysostaphin resistance A-like protein [Gemmataceae bacterium]